MEKLYNYDYLYYCYYCSYYYSCYYCVTTINIAIAINIAITITITISFTMTYYHYHYYYHYCYHYYYAWECHMLIWVPQEVREGYKWHSGFSNSSPGAQSLFVVSFCPGNIWEKEW